MNFEHTSASDASPGAGGRGTRVLLRSLTTALFAGLDGWVADPERAINFLHLDSAIDAACNARWEQIEAVLSVSDRGHRWEIHLPLA